MFETLRQNITNLFKAKAPPTGEIAITESALYTGVGFREYNPDVLIRRKGFKTYDEMRLDDAVKAALTLKKHAVLAPGWEIESASEDKEDREIVEYTRYVFDKMQGSLNDFLLQVMTALDYGYSITEIIWTVFDDGPYRGKVGIRALKAKKPHFYEFDTDDYSNLKPNGLIQTRLALADEKPLPINKFIIYSYQKEFGNWYGMSDLRAAYRAWWSKDNIIKFWNIYLERFGSPLAVGKYKTNNPNSVTNLKTILEKLQSKTSITYRDGEFDISLLEPQRRSTADYKDALDFYNKSIARSILIPDRLMAAGETGAYSQAKIHFDIFLWIVSKLRQDIEEIVMEEQLIRRLVGWNFQDVKELPKFRFNPLTDDQKLELAKAFTDAVQKGAVLPTLDDENHLRRTLNFPEKEVEEESGQQGGAGPQEGQEPDETGEGEKRSMALLQREPTRYEKTVDFAKINNALKDREQKTLDKLREILTKQRDALTAFINSKQINGKLTTKLINTGIDLKYIRDIKQAINDMFIKAYKQGINDSKSEIPKNFIKAKQGIAVIPQKALDYFSAKTDFVVKGIKEPLVTATQGILLNALRTGEAVPKTIKKLQDAYLPYLAAGDIIIDKKQLTSYRLEAIVRTNMSEAYNYGRRAVGEDPDVKDFVIGYQFSEILDDRTVEISEFVDGKIIPVDHPSLPELTYPLHWNERGMFVFVTKDDLPVEFMSEGDIAKAISMKKI
jgi:phage gp29-like protein